MRRILMASSGPDWTELAEDNERLVAPPDARTGATAPAGAVTQQRTSARARAGWRLRGRRTAAAATASLALAGTALASGGLAEASQHPVPAAASWKIVKIVHGSGEPAFTAVTASGAGSAWAFEAPFSGKPVAWQLSGSSWARVSFPGRSGQPVAAAGSSSAADVWAITSNGSRSHALWWNGVRWAAAGSIPASIGDVVVLGHGNVWAFGEPVFPRRASTWHYNGHGWRRLASGHGLSAGSALSAHSIWAVGGTAVAHWNGHAWSRTSVASLLPASGLLHHSSLSGIYAASSANVWAVGTGGRMDEGGPAVVLHFNGTHWSRAALDAASSDPALAQVIPDGSGGLWIPVPSMGGIRSRMLRYSGGHLRTVTMPLPGSRLNVLAVAAIPHTARALSVGAIHKKGQPGAGQSAVILEFGS
jgi:hypothetical protein